MAARIDSRRRIHTADYFALAPAEGMLTGALEDDKSLRAMERAADASEEAARTKWQYALQNPLTSRKSSREKCNDAANAAQTAPREPRLALNWPAGHGIFRHVEYTAGRGQGSGAAVGGIRESARPVRAKEARGGAAGIPPVQLPARSEQGSCAGRPRARHRDQAPVAHFMVETVITYLTCPCVCLNQPRVPRDHATLANLPGELGWHPSAARILPRSGTRRCSDGARNASAVPVGRRVGRAFECRRRSSIWNSFKGL